MNAAEFEARMRLELDIPSIPTAVPPHGYAYRLGSSESIRTTKATVGLIKLLKAQGMEGQQIAKEMWMSESMVSRILNGSRPVKVVK